MRPPAAAPPRPLHWPPCGLPLTSFAHGTGTSWTGPRAKGTLPSPPCFPGDSGGTMASPRYIGGTARPCRCSPPPTSAQGAPPPPVLSLVLRGCALGSCVSGTSSPWCGMGCGTPTTSAWTALFGSPPSRIPMASGSGQGGHRRPHVAVEVPAAPLRTRPPAGRPECPPPVHVALKCGTIVAGGHRRADVAADPARPGGASRPPRLGGTNLTSEGFGLHPG